MVNMYMKYALICGRHVWVRVMAGRMDPNFVL